MFSSFHLTVSGMNRPEQFVGLVTGDSPLGSPVCTLHELMTNAVVFYRAIGGLGIAAFRLIYVHAHRLRFCVSAHEADLKAGGVAAAGVAFSLALSSAHLAEYFWRLSPGDMFHYHYCMKAGSMGHSRREAFKAIFD